MEKLPVGLWPVMLTPFKTDQSIDLDGLVKLTEFYIDAGAHGLFANCLSSEMFQLTNEERCLITKTTIEAADGRIPVIATGTFGSDIANNASFIQRLYDIGAVAVVINTNQLCSELESEEVLKNSLETLMGKTRAIPLGLYECPVPYKRLLSPELMSWLARSGRFFYHKDTSCNLIEIEQKLKAIEGTALGLYNANTPTALTSLQIGASGLSPIGANFYPELITFLIQHHATAERQSQVRKVQHLLSIMDSVIDHHYPFSAKFFLQKRGLNIKTNCRKQRARMAYEDFVKLDAVMGIFDRLMEELGMEPVLRVKNL